MGWRVPRRCDVLLAQGLDPVCQLGAGVGLRGCRPDVGAEAADLADADQVVCPGPVAKIPAVDAGCGIQVVARRWEAAVEVGGLDKVPLARPPADVVPVSEQDTPASLPQVIPMGVAVGQ